MNSEKTRRLIPVIAALVLFAVLAALYLTTGWNGLYRDVILRLGVRPYYYPFLDTDTVMSAARCLHAGVDAYVANPCDPERRAFDYSPLWMVISWLPTTVAWLPWVGMAVVTGFFASLLLLPAARNREGVILVTLGVLSPTAIFAVERGNNDLVIFAIAAGAASVLARPGAASARGYGLMLLAGLLKYYPMLMLAAAFREAPRRFWTVAAACVAVTVLFAAVTWHDLTRALAIIPTGPYFIDMFGAKVLGGGLTEILGLSTSLITPLRLGFTLLSLAIGLWIGLGEPIRRALSQLTPRERSFLLVGALLVCGCFFSAQNIGYRAINLLMMLPALTALRANPDAKGMVRWLAAGAVVLLWSDCWRMMMAGGHMVPAMLDYEPRFAPGWLLREALWWWLVTASVGFAAALLRDGPLPAAVLERLGLSKPVRA